MDWPTAVREWTGVLRSLVIYRGSPAHHRGLVNLYRPLVPKGGLVFDVGSHVGDRVRAFRALGATVVAVEPNPRLTRVLRLLHGRDPGVRLEAVALSDQEGMGRLRVNRANPTVSTLSDDFVAAARDADGWREQVWDAAVDTRVTTLDALISRHGRPDFVKIDAEGLEDRIMAGLSTPVPALSFEITMIARDVGLAALERAIALGFHAFAFSHGESHVIADLGWTDGPALADALRTMPDSVNSGDVYALLDRPG